MIRYFFLASVAAVFISGCVGLVPTGVSEKFAGHWTLGVTFSEFDTLDGRHFYVFAEDMPPTAYKFLTAQRSHRDSTSESGASVSAYFEVVGSIIALRQQSYPILTPPISVYTLTGFYAWRKHTRII